MFVKTCGLKEKGEKFQLYAGVRVLLEEQSFHYHVAKWFFFMLHMVGGMI